ncbi:MAG: hypothetical protein AAGI89_10375 [Pseudomonadota bacterium]
MKRALPLLLFLAACGRNTDFISSMNYALEPVDADCAVASVAELETFELAQRRGDERRTVALFNAGPAEDLKVIIANRRDGSSEASVVIRPGKDVTAGERLASRYAVIAADEAIYLNCTEDGRTYGDSSVIIESEKE